MTIEQAETAATLLKHRRTINAIQARIRCDKGLSVHLMSDTVSIPEEALPYIEEALIKAKEEIEAKIAEL